MGNSANLSGDWIKGLIRDFIAASPNNTLRNKTEEPASDDALIGFASGEEFNVALRRHMTNTLSQVGHAAIAPMLVSNWTVVNSARFSYASSWSERHIDMKPDRQAGCSEKQVYSPSCHSRMRKEDFYGDPRFGA